MKPINLDDKFTLFHNYWSPRIVGEANGQLIKIARALGEMPWHAHDAEDEFFLVLDGELTIELRDHTVVLGPGECFVVPRGCEHRPRATVETRFLLFEPTSTAHTGNAQTSMTVAIKDQPRI
jgi:mannose-6-phosphate isomerase-like protein (cupin superfamily)